MIIELPVVLELVVFVLLVITVTFSFRAIPTITPPFLCHRNTCTKEGNYRCNQNNLFKFRFHVTSSQLRFAHLDETVLEMVYGKSSALRSRLGIQKTQRVAHTM